MAKTANNATKSSSEVTTTNLKSSLRKVDPKVYNQVALFFIIALFLAALAYTGLRISQEQSARQNIKPVDSGNGQDNGIDQTTKQADIDQQRKNDVFLLNSAIQAYFLDKETAPGALKELKNGFVDEVPKDPENDAPYNYKPSEDKKSWSVGAILSDGQVFELSGP